MNEQRQYRPLSYLLQTLEQVVRLRIISLVQESPASLTLWNVKEATALTAVLTEIVSIKYAVLERKDIKEILASIAKLVSFSPQFSGDSAVKPILEKICYDILPEMLVFAKSQ